MDDGSSMVYYISIAYWIWSFDVHSTSATSRELALVALYSVGEGEHRFLHPKSVMNDLERLGRDNPTRLVSYLRGNRNMVCAPCDVRLGTCIDFLDWSHCTGKPSETTTKCDRTLNFA